MDNKRVLVGGCGGREQAICESVKRSKYIDELFCIGTYLNPGILELIGIEHYYILNSNDISWKDRIEVIINDYIKNSNINLVIIGPEKWLEVGLANELFENNIPCIGPLKEYAMIETSKIFARRLFRTNKMERFIPKFEVYNSYLIDDENQNKNENKNKNPEQCNREYARE